MKEFSFEEGKDYYLEKGKIVYTEEYLKKRGFQQSLKEQFAKDYQLEFWIMGVFIVLSTLFTQRVVKN